MLELTTTDGSQLALAATMFTAYSAIVFGIAKYLRKRVWGTPSWEPLAALAIGAVSGVVLVPAILRLSGVWPEPTFDAVALGVYVFLGTGAAAVGESARQTYDRVKGDQ